MKSITRVLKSAATTALIGIIAVAAIGCGQETETDAPSSSTIDQAAKAPESQQEVVEVAESAPDLPTAPDFSLPAANRDNAEVSLSSFQGEKPVVLVFYRAYW